MGTVRIMPSLFKLVLGPAGHQRVRVSQTLLALFVFVLFAVLQQGEVMLGLIEAQASNLLTAFNLAGSFIFYLLIRSGLSLRLGSDASMTLAQSVFALISVCGSYAITGPARGAVMSILILVVLFGMFKLTPRQARGLALLGFVLLAATMGWRAGSGAGLYDPRVELVNFVFAAIIMGATAALSIRLGRLRARLSEQKAELARALELNREMATRDALTGLLNRRAMTELLQQEHPQVQRTAGVMSLALLDIDWFKKVNDTHGHGVGDAVLQRFAEVARQGLRRGDALARWGGEEFLLMMPGTPPNDAMRALDRLRQRVAAADFGTFAPGLAVTFSGGLAACGAGEPVEHAIERADRALYRAKHSGRDRIERAQPPQLELA